MLIKGDSCNLKCEYLTVDYFVKILLLEKTHTCRATFFKIHIFPDLRFSSNLENLCLKLLELDMALTAKVGQTSKTHPQNI